MLQRGITATTLAVAKAVGYRRANAATQQVRLSLCCSAYLPFCATQLCEHRSHFYLFQPEYG